MFASEILKENDFRVVSNGDGFNVVSRQSGEVVGRHRIRGGAETMARDLNNGPRVVNASDGRVRAEYNGQRITGTPSEVAQRLAEMDDSPIDQDRLDRAPQRAQSKGRRFIGWLIRTKFFAFVGAAQLAPVVVTYFQQRAMMTEIWRIYPEGHPFALGSPYAQEQIDRTMQPYLNSMYAAIAVVAVDVLISMIRGGKALRVLRVIYAGVPPVGPWGLALRGIIFALTEGGLLAATWAIQRYGPNFFTAMANDKFVEWVGMQDDETVTTNPDFNAQEPDGRNVQQEILNRLRQERNGEEPEDDNSASTPSRNSSPSTPSNEPSTDDDTGFSFGR